MKYAVRSVSLFVLSSIFLLSGCVVRTYTATKDRIDQDLSVGNRGYLQGQAPAAPSERKAVRSTRVVEVELRSPLKFEKTSRSRVESTQPAMEGETAGNRGVFEQGQSAVSTEAAGSATMQKYTVQKNDTLQKISQKFYGTTKKWTKIYEANKDTLSAPDKIYPGQEINIPEEGLKEPGLKEPAENLK